MFSKIVLVLSIICVIAEARQLQVKNARGQLLKLSVSGQSDVTLLPGQTVLVNVADNWSGSISATSTGCSGSCSVKTVAQLQLGAVDQYAVSLVNGFNGGVKIVPISGTNCQAAVCAAKITNKCPVADRITNALGQVVACQNSPVVFQALCPGAIVTAGDNTKIQSCSALSYLIHLS